ncbi:LysR family transcriptional regulator [Saccharopolyspora sp. NFXS83]|uniref:LysR family transcriptional regulator n=1 Tax=Saccharopolyspora sp. NFXS83 TaxID=2993560 RepID=UPI00224A730C|nr:LysR family transcriptional regulator [Saccharopolyspora sp. NFXS83]MCX2731899.1 LysR family transcriptional regulator [Saccharopolyspora sp. NFXS83]
MLNWERLRVLAAVAEHGSVAAAAAALHVTGPAITQQIRKLEREAGTALVEPEGRGMRLTTAGWIVAEAAGAAGGKIAAAEHALSELDGRAVGPLRIGALHSSFRLLLAPALHKLALRHPDVLPSARSGGGAIDMIPLLLSHDLDAVIIENWSSLPMRMPPRVQLHPLVDHDVVLAVGSEHPLASRERIDLSDVRDQVWAACPPGTDHHEAQLHIMRRHDIEVDVRFVADDFPTQMTIVAGGLAVSLAPRAAVESFPGVRLIPVSPTVTRTIAVAIRGGPPSPAVEALVVALREVVRVIPGQTPADRM